MKKRCLKWIFSAILLICVCSVGVDAATPTIIQPRAENLNNCTYSFIISPSGSAQIAIFYDGRYATFSLFKSTVKIEKRFLGVFWKTVDIGLENDEWREYSEAISGSLYNSFQVDGSGTYRAKFLIEVYGVNGTVDTIEDTIETKYG